MSARKAPFFDPLIRLSVNGGRRALDTLLPPHSLLDGKVLKGREHDQDRNLWRALEFLDDPCCSACGFPFEFDQGEGALCLNCHANRPIFNQARAAMSYTEKSRKLILDFKHGGRTDGLDFFAAQMNRAGRDMLKSCNMLIPVPLHAQRLRARRFNQAALLARALARRTRKPYFTHILSRSKNTPPQGAKTAPARKKNVAGAFTTKNRTAISGQHIVLIDDVYTTGATVNACAKSLKRAGARQIDVLTLLRVVRPLDIQK